MSFSKFFNTVTSYLEPVVDFVLGDEIMTPDLARAGKGPQREGGFLGDLVKGGAKAYMSMSERNSDDRAFQSPEYREPTIRRYSGQAPRAQALAPAPQILGASDPRVRRMLTNLSNRNYANAQMNRLSSDMRVAINRRQGQRTIGLDRPATPQVQEAAPAQVRKHSQDVT
tara:strand:- start:8646 stop:9155 length:510 start_codon:yes stop_codon:yes gene_type:complete